MLLRYTTEKTETLYCLNSYQRGFGFLVGTPDKANYARESVAGWAFLGGEVVIITVAAFSIIQGCHPYSHVSMRVEML